MVAPPPADIPEDRSFQERFWTTERVAWVGFAVMVAAAAIGLFGSGGPLSRASTTFGSTRVDYPLFARWDTADDLTIHLSPGSRSVILSSSFVDAFRIESVQPTPERVVAEAEGLTYAFSAEGNAPITVRIDVMPRNPGFAAFEITIPGSGTADAWIFVWP